jgi:adenylyltransferase/sulfurtransferase
MLMALSDAQIERYSRQILLPDVGGRGQERLLTTRVAIRGTDLSAVVAATLLGRAGIGRLELADALDVPELSPDCRVTRAGGEYPLRADLVVDVGDGSGATHAGERPLLIGRLGGAAAVLVTLVGRPCFQCVDPADLPSSAGVAGEPLGSLAARALGALAATEALRLLLLPPHGRRTVVDVDRGTVESRALAHSTTCPACGSDA